MKKLPIALLASIMTIFPYTALADGTSTSSTSTSSVTTTDSVSGSTGGTDTSSSTGSDGTTTTTSTNSGTTTTGSGSTTGTSDGSGTGGTGSDGTGTWTHPGWGWGQDRGDQGGQNASGGTYGADGQHEHGLANALSHVKNPVALAVLQALSNGESPLDAIEQLFGGTSGGAGSSTDGSTTGTSGVTTGSGTDGSTTGTSTSSGSSSGSGTDSGTGTTTTSSSSDPSSSTTNMSTTDLSSVTQQLIAALEHDQQDSKNVRKAAFERIAQAAQTNGDVQNGVQAGQDAVAIDPTDVSSFDSLGKLYQIAGDTSVKAFVDGTQPSFDVKPFIKDGRTMVPVRAIVEALGAQVNWDPSMQTITVTRDGHTVTLTIGSTTALVDGQPKTLDVPAFVAPGDRTVVPARFLTEAFGALVTWIPTGSIVDITTTDGTSASGGSSSSSTSASGTSTDGTGTSASTSSSTDTSTSGSSSTGTTSSGT